MRPRPRCEASQQSTVDKLQVDQNQRPQSSMSTVRYLGIEVDDALAIAERVDV
jgi:hypothetical protein